MLQALGGQIQALLGLEREISEVGAGQMALRTLIVYAAALAIVRLGSRRFLSEAAAFDVIVAIMLGSIVSRAINGSAPLVPTLLAGAVLLGVHWLIAVLAFHTSWLGSIVKGNRVLLIRDGKVQREGLRKASITSEDLGEAMRLQIGQTDPARVQLAYMERNGKISVLPYPHEPRIVEISVRAGVQTVRVEIS